MSEITLESGDFGTYRLVDESGNDILIHSDWDLPAVASHLGFSPCFCGETDGTVDCEHKTATQMISEAAEYLDSCIGDAFEDPGYFN